MEEQRNHDEKQTDETRTARVRLTRTIQLMQVVSVTTDREGNVDDALAWKDWDETGD